MNGLGTPLSRPPPVRGENRWNPLESGGKEADGRLLSFQWRRDERAPEPTRQVTEG